MKRRIMPLLLTLCLLLGLMIPAAAEDSAPTYPTENGFTYMVQDKAAVILGYAEQDRNGIDHSRKAGRLSCFRHAGILLHRVSEPEESHFAGSGAFAWRFCL